MRKSLLIVFMITNVLNSQKIKQNQLIIDGFYETKVMTNEARFHFSVEGLGSSLKEAFENAHKK